MIRKLQATDWPIVKAIYIQGIRSRNATLENESSVTDFANWYSHKIKDSCFVWIENDVIKGWATLSPVSSRCVYAGVAEVSVYVDKDAHGLGIGKSLLKALISYAENNDIWTLQAGIFPENKASTNLHKKLGFREVGYREKIGQLNGKWRDVLLFERRSSVIV